MSPQCFTLTGYYVGSVENHTREMDRMLWLACFSAAYRRKCNGNGSLSAWKGIKCGVECQIMAYSHPEGLVP